MTLARGFLCILLAAAFLPACERSYVEGRVTDVRGEALPGVIVRVGNGPAQELSNGLGRYRIAAARGAQRLVFSKTGYSSGELTVADSSRAGADIALWPLPLNPGIYVIDDLRYFEVTWVAPKEYQTADGMPNYGVVLPKELREAPSEPFIAAYRTTRYNARLSRLVPAEAEDASAASATELWVEAGTMAAALEPVDPPEGKLLRLQVGRALEPGVYGVHWGALSGYTTLDTRVFLFRVPEPSAIEPLTAEPPAAPSGKAGDVADAQVAPPKAVVPAADGEGAAARPEPIEPPAEITPAPPKP